MKPSHPPSTDERLGVWRLHEPVAAVTSGPWWRVEHVLGRQPALALRYEAPADAAAVMLRMSQSAGEPWRDARLAWPLDAGLSPDGRAYVVMPTQDGLPLLAALATASLRQRLGWVSQLASLLHEADERGLRLMELDPSLLWIDAQQTLRLQALALLPAQAAGQGLTPLQGARSSAAAALHGLPLHAPGSAADLVQALSRLLCLLVTGRLPGDAQPPRAPVTMVSDWLSLRASERSRLDALLDDLLHADAGAAPASPSALAARLEAWLTDDADAAADAADAADVAVTPQAGAASAAPPRIALPPVVPPTPPYAPAWQAPPRRGPAAWLWPLTIVALALGGALGLYLLH